MIDEFSRQSGKDAQDFHVRPERAVQLVGEQGLTGIVPVFLYQGNGFGQQFDARFQFVLLPPVFQPQSAFIVGVQILTGNGYGVCVGGSGITGKQEQVPRQDEGAALFRNVQVTQLLEVLPAQRLRGGLLLLGYLEMQEMVPLGESLLVRDPANPFQQGQMVPRGLVGIPACHFDIRLTRWRN